MPGASAAAGAGGQGVGLVDDQQGADLAGQLAQARHEARLRQDHADVGQRRLAEHRGHVAGGQRRLQRGQVVERHHAAVLGQVARLADQPRTVHGVAVAGAHHGLVDGAVVAAIEHQDHLAPGDRPRPAQDEAVGVGGGGRHLPERQAEALGQALAADHRILTGQHGGQAAPGLLAQGRGNRRRRVAEHAAGIAQAEVDVLAAVDVDEARALGALDEQRHRRRPVAHPVHRHAAEQRMASAPSQRHGLRMLLEKALALACGKGLHRRFGDSTGVHA
ncbi:hypothetical protein D3C80_1239850 [compost metagenome]